MARKLHSQNTKRIVFGEQRTTHIKGIRLDRNNRKIEFTKYGDETHWMGWNIHHIDFNHRNNSIDNFEAINYKTHKELHDNK